MIHGHCVHPGHIAAGLAEGGDWRSRIIGLRANGSARGHAELDAATELDEDGRVELAQHRMRCGPYAGRRLLRHRRPPGIRHVGCVLTE